MRLSCSFAFKKYNIRWEGLDEVGVDQNGTIRVKINLKYYRPCEVDLLLGNAKKADAFMKNNSTSTKHTDKIHIYYMFYDIDNPRISKRIPHTMIYNETDIHKI